MGLACAEAPAQGLPPLRIDSVEVDPDFDEMLKPQLRGYLGADGAASVRLSSDRILWVFGDTILGNSFEGQRRGPMVRNSIGIQDVSGGFPGTVEYYWNLEDRITGDFFRPKSWQDSHWFWPGCGIKHNGTIYLFLTKLVQGEGDDGFAFETIDCTLFRVRNPNASPDDWHMEQVDLGFGNQHFNINVASMVEGDYVYLLGYDDGPEQYAPERMAFLARLHLDALESDAPGDAVEFLSIGDEWRDKPDALKPLFRPGTTESGLYFDEAIGRYVTGTMDPFTPHMYLATAEKLTGPWTLQHVYDIPQLVSLEDDNYHAYTPRVHPLLSAEPGVIVMTYVINTQDFWSMFADMDIYYPRFVRVEVAP